MKIELGQKVKITGFLKRTSERKEAIFSEDRKFWKKKDCSCEMNGIIVGTRTLQNGTRYWNIDEGCSFSPNEFFKAYIVFYSLTRKPVFCLKEQMTLIT